jgi:hypothetical protein
MPAREWTIRPTNLRPPQPRGHPPRTLLCEQWHPSPAVPPRRSGTAKVVLLPGSIPRTPRNKLVLRFNPLGRYIRRLHPVLNCNCRFLHGCE